jgi:Putative Ig domain
MSINEQQSAFVDPTAMSIGLSQIFTVTATSPNPTYLVLTALDRDEYTAGEAGATGDFSGNGHILNMSSIGGDGRGAGIVFTLQPNGRYYNSTYGYLDQLTYNSSGSAGDVTNLSLFGTNNLNQANACASSAYSMMQADAAGYLGSATIVTQANTTGSVPAQATPDSIAAAAQSFIGQAWNMDGCWVLASTIAADAGTSLPVQSTLIGQPGQANGEWIAAFNGPAGQSGNWQSMVTAGEIVVIGTPGGGGHITTCVSGSGSTAMLVDNITYENGSGQILNSANDGSSNDIIVPAPHAASQEWAGVEASSVVIYELDTPVVSDRATSDSLACNATQTLSLLFTGVDPANKAITEWQAYDTATGDMLVLSGVDYQDHSAASALTATSLSAVSLLGGSAATRDTLEVRAFNGTYWGDWTSLAVAVVASGQNSPSPPVLAAQTAAQTWLGGKAVSLALPAGTFTDPPGQTLTYRAALANGQVLPGWLSLNAATDTFSGTAPTAAQTLNIVVTATDGSGLSATDAFSANVLGTPTLTAPTGNQAWTEGATISLVLPANTFTDPQGEALTYAATQSNGQALPPWLTFNPATETFTGTAPSTAQSLGITVTATDSSGLSSSENFTASIQPAAPAVIPGISVTAQTPNQTWVDGQEVNLALPSNTFTDALGLKMIFVAYENAGPNVTPWLHFNAATEDFYGKVPLRASGTAQLAVVAFDGQSMAAADLFTVTFAAASQTPSPFQVPLPWANTTFNPRPSSEFIALHT